MEEINAISATTTTELDLICGSAPWYHWCDVETIKRDFARLGYFCPWTALLLHLNILFYTTLVM